jgi:U3 small nucleolar RNA-associated protein 21
VVLRQPEWPSNTMMSPDAPEHQALCVSLSSCGHFALVGTRGGVVYKYNMQSGMVDRR